MSNESTFANSQADIGLKLVYWLALTLVIVGLLNSMPGIPGLDNGAAQLVGWKNFTIRKYPYEYFYPIVFGVMMVIVALKHSVWRELHSASPGRRRMGLMLDVALVVAAIGISFTYIIEIEAVCIIDQMTGERAELIAKSLKAERNSRTFMDFLCRFSGGPAMHQYDGWGVGGHHRSGCHYIPSLQRKSLGLPLVLVAIAIAAYTIITALVWYFYGADDINKYLITKLGGDPDY